MESGGSKNFEHELALGGVSCGEFVVVALREMQGNGASLLERSGGADGQKIVDFANWLCRSRRSENPADAPSGDAVGF